MTVALTVQFPDAHILRAYLSQNNYPDSWQRRMIELLDAAIAKATEEKKPYNRYIVGTRDRDGNYRANRVEAPSATEAKTLAVERAAKIGTQVIAVSVQQINALGLRAGNEDMYGGVTYGMARRKA